MNEDRTSSNNELLENLLVFSVKVAEVSDNIKDTPAGELLMRSLIKSATAIGRCCYEAQEMTTEDGFIDHVGRALTHARATQYLIKVIQYGRLGDEKQLTLLEKECDQIATVLSQSITAMEEEEE